MWAAAGILLPVSGQTIKRGAKAVDKIPGVNKFRSEIARRVSEKLGKKGTKLRKCELEVKNKNIETGNLNGNANTNIKEVEGLKKQLSFKEAEAIFNKNGTLKAEVIEKSKQIIKGEQLNNKKLLSELEKQGGNLKDWGKYETQSFKSPAGEFKMHFYHNPKLNKTYYDMDYKAVYNNQGNWGGKK